jgi:hypothetical protein
LYKSFNTKKNTKMKNSILTLVAIAILAISGVANAQNTSTAPATASAEMVCPITLSKVADLSFGRVVIGTGTAIMNNAGGLTYTGNVAPGPNNDYVGDSHPASFHVTGQSAFFFNITNSGNNVVVSNGSNTLNVTLNAPNDGNPVRLSYVEGPGCNGVYDFTLGGTLTVTTAAVPGTYSGTWNETVTYN